MKELELELAKQRDFVGRMDAIYKEKADQIQKIADRAQQFENFKTNREREKKLLDDHTLWKAYVQYQKNVFIENELGEQPRTVTQEEKASVIRAAFGVMEHNLPSNMGSDLIMFAIKNDVPEGKSLPHLNFNCSTSAWRRDRRSAWRSRA